MGKVFYDRLVNGDCLVELPKVESNSIDLVVCDPPYNLGVDYGDHYDDSKSPEEYLAWCEDWGDEVLRVLKPDGTFWLVIGENYASELDVMFRAQCGFHKQHRVIWHYTFGVNNPKRFTPSHVHLFHFTKHRTRFTFNAGEVKVPSARQLVYNDRRAKAGGRLPDNVWFLRPQDAGQDYFRPDSDVWHVPRVAGTFKERARFACQMPLPVLDRIVKVSSNPGEIVLDPMSGSGTTLVSAARLGRRYYGIELSEKSCDVARSRLGREVPQDEY